MNEEISQQVFQEKVAKDLAQQVEGEAVSSHAPATVSTDQVLHAYRRLPCWFGFSMRVPHPISRRLWADIFNRISIAASAQGPTHEALAVALWTQ